jgi:hypothetical protein
MPQDNLGFLSLMILVWGLLAAVVLTFLWRRKKWVLAIGPVLMFVASFAAQNVAVDEGEGACAGAIVLPLVGLAASWLILKLAALRRS